MCISHSRSCSHCGYTRPSSWSLCPAFWTQYKKAVKTGHLEEKPVAEQCSSFKERVSLFRIGRCPFSRHDCPSQQVYEAYLVAKADFEANISSKLGGTRTLTKKQKEYLIQEQFANRAFQRQASPIKLSAGCIKEGFQYRAKLRNDSDSSTNAFDDFVLTDNSEGYAAYSATESSISDTEDGDSSLFIIVPGMGFAEPEVGTVFDAEFNTSRGIPTHVGTGSQQHAKDGEYEADKSNKGKSEATQWDTEPKTITKSQQLALIDTFSSLGFNNEDSGLVCPSPGVEMASPKTKGKGTGTPTNLPEDGMAGSSGCKIVQETSSADASWTISGEADPTYTASLEDKPPVLPEEESELNEPPQPRKTPWSWESLTGLKFGPR